jgi:hypothetical protein
MLRSNSANKDAPQIQEEDKGSPCQAGSGQLMRCGALRRRGGRRSQQQNASKAGLQQSAPIKRAKKNTKPQEALPQEEQVQLRAASKVPSETKHRNVLIEQDPVYPQFGIFQNEDNTVINARGRNSETAPDIVETVAYSVKADPNSGLSSLAVGISGITLKKVPSSDRGSKKKKKNAAESNESTVLQSAVPHLYEESNSTRGSLNSWNDSDNNFSTLPLQLGDYTNYFNCSSYSMEPRILPPSGPVATTSSALCLSPARTPLANVGLFRERYSQDNNSLTSTLERRRLVITDSTDSTVSDNGRDWEEDNSYMLRK